MPIGPACTAVSENMSTWGACLQEGIFFNDAVLMAFTLYLLIGIIVWRLRLPGEMILVFGLLCSYGMYLMNPVPAVFIVFVLAAVLALASFAYILVKRLYG
jgi:hypothetical protein